MRHGGRDVERVDIVADPGFELATMMTNMLFARVVNCPPASAEEVAGIVSGVALPGIVSRGDETLA